MVVVYDSTCSRCGHHLRVVDHGPNMDGDYVHYECPCKPIPIDPYSFYIGYCRGKGLVPNVKTYRLNVPMHLTLRALEPRLE